MHFKHPEVLYALLALIIPLIVHLFKLRKYKTQYFTNVSMLREIVNESRKISQLKRWLLLFTRLLLLSGLIIAFAQPYDAKSTPTNNTHLVVALDNSLSMSGQVDFTNLLEKAKQDLLSSIPENQDFSLVTLSNTYKNIQLKDLKQILPDIKISPKAFDIKELQLQLNNFDTPIQPIILSDFYKLNTEAIQELLTEFNKTQLINYAQLQPKNIAIEQAYLVQNQLQVLLKSNQPNTSSSLALYQAETLLGKADVSFEKDTIRTINFDVGNQIKEPLRLELSSDYLNYDNRLFLNQPNLQQLEVLIISNQKANYLKTAFEVEPYIKVKIKTSSQLSLDDFNTANLIVSHELENLDINLLNNLEKALEDSKNLIVIPSTSVEAQSRYKNLKLNGKVIFNGFYNQSQKIINISTEHPLFNDVFTSPISNFDYPSTTANYRLNSQFSNLIGYGNTPFYGQDKGLFVFAAELKSDGSNFSNSPLIIPALIKSAQYQQAKDKLFYFTNTQPSIRVNEVNQGDQVFKLNGNGKSYIPLQEKEGNTTRIELENLDVLPGHYTISSGEDSLSVISINQNRKESKLVPLKGEFNYKTLKDSIEAYKQLNTDDDLWKWFLSFALFCMLIEILIVKIFK